MFDPNMPLSRAVLDRVMSGGYVRDPLATFAALQTPRLEITPQQHPQGLFGDLPEAPQPQRLIPLEDDNIFPLLLGDAGQILTQGAFGVHDPRNADFGANLSVAIGNASDQLQAHRAAQKAEAQARAQAAAEARQQAFENEIALYEAQTGRIDAAPNTGAASAIGKIVNDFDNGVITKEQRDAAIEAELLKNTPPNPASGIKGYGAVQAFRQGLINAEQAKQAIINEGGDPNVFSHILGGEQPTEQPPNTPSDDPNIPAMNFAYNVPDLNVASAGDWLGAIKGTGNAALGAIGLEFSPDQQQAIADLNVINRSISIPLVKSISDKGSVYTQKQIDNLLPQYYLSDSKNKARVRALIPELKRMKKNVSKVLSEKYHDPNFNKNYKQTAYEQLAALDDTIPVYEQMLQNAETQPSSGTATLPDDGSFKWVEVQ